MRFSRQKKCKWCAVHCCIPHYPWFLSQPPHTFIFGESGMRDVLHTSLSFWSFFIPRGIVVPRFTLSGHRALLRMATMKSSWTDCDGAIKVESRLYELEMSQGCICIEWPILLARLGPICISLVRHIQQQYVMYISHSFGCDGAARQAYSTILLLLMTRLTLTVMYSRKSECYSHIQSYLPEANRLGSAICLSLGGGIL